MESSAPAPLGINYLDTLAQQFLEGHDPLGFGTEFHAADGSFPGSLDLQADNLEFQWPPQVSPMLSQIFDARMHVQTMHVSIRSEC